MHRIDFTPVFRSTIGFDRMARLVDAAFQASEGSNNQSYPPYNIEKLSEDSYQITMAVAGFSEQDHRYNSKGKQPFDLWTDWEEQFRRRRKNISTSWHSFTLLREAI